MNPTNLHGFYSSPSSASLNSNNLIEPMTKSKCCEKMFELINCFVIKRSMLKLSTFKISIFKNINLI
ncbi:hypothetical protein BpHYR1_001309 [Brachionus plicatilis]|uniref:Uncharacterized protein n=1 Tax=Brachionus plicatilis TaxID=10195 RepID=A0A3M7T797_BRAPC|nr:hypothetical protein BpHYR1_001309 [Brachionus plicatilis]